MGKFAADFACEESAYMAIAFCCRFLESAPHVILSQAHTWAVLHAGYTACRMQCEGSMWKRQSYCWTGAGRSMRMAR